MRKTRVLHVSTAHPPDDPRIVFKQCQSLRDSYEVFCALPHARSTTLPGIRFISLPYFQRVYWRVLITAPLVLLRCLWLRPQLLHIYVPELIPVAYVFRLFGTKVIYEVQENLYKKLSIRTLNRGWLLERAFRWFDQRTRRHFYLVFTEHGYLSTYADLRHPYTVIYNYPLLSCFTPFQTSDAPMREKPAFFYIGRISFERSFDVLVAALVQLLMEYPGSDVHLFGEKTFSDEQAAVLPNYEAIRKQLHFHGDTSHTDAFPMAAACVAGLALLKPVGDYTESYPTKLFEYMALGLPVITSDFPLYREIVDAHRCGFCILPNDAQQLAHVMKFLIEHPTEAKHMGERGRKVVETSYNWQSESQKLTAFYAEVLNA